MANRKPKVDPALAMKGMGTPVHFNGQNPQGVHGHKHSVAIITEYFRAQYWDADIKSWRSIKYRAATEEGARAFVAGHDFWRITKVRTRRRRGEQVETSSTIVSAWEPPNRIERFSNFVKVAAGKGIGVDDPALIRVAMQHFGMTRRQAIERLRMLRV